MLTIINLSLPTIAHAYDEKAVEWLAYNIYHEARGEPLHGKFIIAFVTINRVESDYFPNTIRDVITQPEQFSWYWDGKPDHPKETQSFEICFSVSKMAYSLWKSGRVESLIRQMNLDKVYWYHSEDVSPTWRYDYQYVTKVGKHLLYKEM